MAAIKINNGRKGWFLDLSTLDGGPKLDTPVYEKTDEQKARETWVCSICGKSTYEVDYDYIGSGTNHLGCELRLEQDENYRKKNWSQKKHEDKVFDEYAEDIDEQAHAQGRESSYDDMPEGLKRAKELSQEALKEGLQNQAYMEMTSDGLPEGGDSQAVRDSKTWVDKLAEEIVSDNDTGYIYESPDSGKTVYKRKEGSDKRELVKDWKKVKNNE